MVNDEVNCQPPNRDSCIMPFIHGNTTVHYKGEFTDADLEEPGKQDVGSRVLTKQYSFRPCSKINLVWPFDENCIPDIFRSFVQFLL